MSTLDCADITTHGCDGYEMYRAPGIVVAPNNDILLYYEARKKDTNRRSLLCRRSCDGGVHFQEPIALKSDDGVNMLHNPLMIADPAGKVYFFWNENYRRLFMQVSEDNARTFGPARELTEIVMAWREEYPVQQFAVAPGHGLILHEGTLLLPLWMSRSATAHAPAVFATLHSADGGETWRRSNVVDSTAQVIDPTEGSVAQLADGSLLATLRHAAPNTRRRAFVRGNVGCWEKAYLDNTLPDPICAGSLMLAHDGTLLFANCANEDEPCLARRRRGEDVRWSKDARQKLTLRRSVDGGKTWSKGSQLSFEGGYSDMACSRDGQWIYCIYERGWLEGDSILNAHLAFARFTPDWVK